MNCWNIGIPRVRVTYALKCYLAFLLILIFLPSLSCGKRKTRVSTPIPPSAPPAVSTGPEAPQTQPTPSPSPEPPSAAIPTTVPELRDPASGIPESPSIRVGLTTTAREILISSSGDYYVLGKEPEEPRRLIQGTVRVRVEREGDISSSVYRVQVASFANPEAAESLRKKLHEAFNVPAIVQKNSATGTNRVRVGEFSLREGALVLLKALRENGYPDAFVIEDATLSANGDITLALRGSNSLFRLSRSGFLFLPSASADYLHLDGKPYRGFFDISLNQSGRITVVNQLGVEEYLLGVVPAEIGPSYHSEFEALAAQSIAARTYALRNMGRYRDEGFDLTADTRTQVYKGVSWEKDATSKAVLKTAGLAIYYRDELIDAMYMSTCGGHTEDFSNVFDAPDVPYLKGVFCAVESGAYGGDETVIAANHELKKIITGDDGSIANRNLELARVLGLVEVGSGFSEEDLAEPAEMDEMVRWVKNARKVAQKCEDLAPPSIADSAGRADLLAYAAESFFGVDEIERGVSPGDARYYLGNLSDGGDVPESCRSALAYIMKRGLWHPFLDNTMRPDAPLRRSEAISLLLGWIESENPGILRTGTFSRTDTPDVGGPPESSIEIKGGNQTQEFPISPKLFLFRADAGRAIPVSSLRIIGNEKMRFHVSPSGTIDFLEVELNPTGASSDRYSPAATWDVTMDRAAVAEKIGTLAGDIGKFKDLKPYRTGNSGRAVQIQVIGSSRSVVLNGYKVRGALGLKDTLFTIVREHNPDGSIARFTFHGRGWGHGIGLCQVGAFGMAQAGRSYEEILKTYYQGVQIRKAY